HPLRSPLFPYTTLFRSFLVPQVDADGNERAGIHLPEVSVPLATYTGWNFRNAKIGGTDQLVSLLGSYIPLTATKAEREAAKDPRSEEHTSELQSQSNLV